MRLTGVHLLLTYRCTHSCEHCFVWGSPLQGGVMTLSRIDEIIRQGEGLGTVRSVYFEGGEPFLFYPLLLHGVRAAARRGFAVGVVTNAYWATSPRDCREWLGPLVGLVGDLAVSGDLYHGSEDPSREVLHATAAAEGLGIPVGVIGIAQPGESDAFLGRGQLPPGKSRVMYRGRAAVRLAPRAAQRPWREFTECPCEDLEEPGRMHVDPYGNLHICQGIIVGNLFRTPLVEICDGYRVESHPVTAPLHSGGPAALAREYGLTPDGTYADACHFCYDCRSRLRGRFPEDLGPEEMYGAPGEE